MSNSINKQDAIKAVGKWMQKEFGYLDLNRSERLIDTIEALPSADRPIGWIPCNKSLPKENGKYIASLEDSVYPWANFFNGKWFMLSLNGIAREFGEYEVIAWMPLPEPYKAESEDKE